MNSSLRTKKTFTFEYSATNHVVKIVRFGYTVYTRNGNECNAIVSFSTIKIDRNVRIEIRVVPLGIASYITFFSF